ncbi:alpha/beta hydrolase [Limisalsivibrio acetivorans]|uniref:alpha/beta hydrolase n=1 Tax=Limisalsivibrio acetivorans TaxID=1304888 RepID=UPI0003B34D26|nr:alpha/beta hydrolase [Limisalsivibrio acetivorans]
MKILARTFIHTAVLTLCLTSIAMAFSDLSPYVIRYQCTGGFIDKYHYNAVPEHKLDMRKSKRIEDKYESNGRELDVISYYPEGNAMGVVVFFHGGGWTGGEPEQLEFMGEFLSGLGFVVHLPSYRKVWDYHMPFISVDDAKSAVIWAESKHSGGRAGEYFIIGGESAGGHLALSMLTIPLFSYNIDIKPDKLILLNPITRLRKEGYYRDEYRVNKKFIEPYNYIGDGLPETLFIHGDKDNTVPYVDSWNTNMKMVSKGNVSYLCNSRTFIHGYYYENKTKRASLLNLIRTFLADK